MSPLATPGATVWLPGSDPGSRTRHLSLAGGDPPLVRLDLKRCRRAPAVCSVTLYGISYASHSYLGDAYSNAGNTVAGNYAYHINDIGLQR